MIEKVFFGVPKSMGYYDDIKLPVEEFEELPDDGLPTRRKKYDGSSSFRKSGTES